MVVFCGSGFSGRFAMVMNKQVSAIPLLCNALDNASRELRSICTDLPSNDIMNRGYAEKDGLSFLRSAPT